MEAVFFMWGVHPICRVKKSSDDFFGSIKSCETKLENE
jgi:hypothetical protein